MSRLALVLLPGGRSLVTYNEVRDAGLILSLFVWVVNMYFTKCMHVS